MKIAHGPNYARMSSYLQRQIAKEFVMLGRFIIRDNVARIPRKVDYNNAAQKANKPSTIRRKGHDTPLLDTGQLSNASAYTINGVPAFSASTPSTPNIVIRPPDDRIDILGYLRAKGYVYWGISAAARREAGRLLSVAWNGAVKRL